MGIVFLFIPIIVQIVLLNLLSKFLSGLFFRKLGRTLYLVFMWPGVVVHEMSHLIGCWLTRTKVLEVKFFSPRDEAGGSLTLGYVSHVKPRNPLASMIIGSAPFFGGAAVLWLLLRWFFPTVTATATFHPVILKTGAAAASWAFVSAVASDYLVFFKALFSALAAGGWISLVFVYLLIPLASHIAPSGPDLKHTIWGVVTVAASVSLVILIGRYISPAVPGRVSDLIAGPIGGLNVLLSYGLACTLVATIIFGSAAMILGFVRSRFRRSPLSPAQL
jgi:hypothetical protein